MSLRDWLSRRLGRPQVLFDPAWGDLLERDFEHWRTLDDAERERMEMLVASMVHGVRWEAANGFELTDSIRVSAR